MLGPKNGTLTVRTGRHGRAAKAGHNLLIEVGAWSASVKVAGDPGQSALELTADSRSLRVLDGTGGIHGLTEHDKAGIAKTINEEVLKGTAIAFRSTSIEADGTGRMTVRGDLDLSGTTRPVGFELALGDDGRIAGSAKLTQSGWGMKPYSAMFGALKVNDEVEVAIDATLSGPAEVAASARDMGPLSR
jgi:polyisoprenoid-binding protein YceI